MTTADPPPTRRSLRTLETAAVPAAAPAAAIASTATALAWLDEAAVGPAPAHSTAIPSGFRRAATDLLDRAPRRSPIRPGVLLPIAAVLVLVAGYCATTLLWPLTAVAPEVIPAVAAVAAPPASPAWPAQGSGAVTVAGMGSSAASAGDPVPIASITKVVTALVVLDRMPLRPGQEGPAYRFGYADRAEYWDYRERGESALDVPVGGTLSEYQLLQGMLIGSAGNYADRLAGSIWGSDAAFADAAGDWLSRHGIAGITVVEPTGIDPRNTATPDALLTLGRRALADPVIAGIVATPVVDLPGAGIVENTNPLVADPGVTGVKTGSLETFALLAAKEVPVGPTTVSVLAVALGQPDDQARDAAVRALLARTEEELRPFPSVAAGSVVGTIAAAWGERVDVVAAADAEVALWNGAAATITPALALTESWEGGAPAGTVTATGPLDASTIDAVLAEAIDGPSPWWRLTHPLALFGLA